jgi:hypothetical protein
MAAAAFNSLPLNINGANFSTSVWARRTGNGLDQSVYSEYGNYGTQTWRYGLWFASSNVTSIYWGATSMGMGTPAATGSWAHYVMVNNGNTVTAYRDGAVAATYTCSGSNCLASGAASGGFFVGCHAGNGACNTNGYYFVGDVDELAIFSKALTQAEVQSIYQYGVDGSVTTLGAFEIQQVGADVKLVNRENATVKLKLSVSY